MSNAWLLYTWLAGTTSCRAGCLFGGASNLRTWIISCLESPAQFTCAKRDRCNNACPAMLWCALNHYTTVVLPFRRYAGMLFMTSWIWLWLVHVDLYLNAWLSKDVCAHVTYSSGQKQESLLDVCIFENGEAHVSGA